MLNGDVGVSKIVLLVSAQYMYAASQERICTDCAGSNVALWAYVSAFMDRCIPMRKHCEKTYENVVGGVWASQPIKCGPRVNTNFSGNQTKCLGEGLKCAIRIT